MSATLLSEHDRPDRRHYTILLVSWAGWLFDFYDLILYTFLLGAIGKELNLSKATLSITLGASLAATAVGGMIFGNLADRYGRKAVLQWTIITYSLGTLLCGFSHGLAMLIGFRILTGLGVGGEWATGQTYVGETFPPKMRGRFGAFMQTGAPLGVMLASVVGGFLLPAIGWRACFFVSVLPAALVWVIRTHVPESDMWERRRISGVLSNTWVQIEQLMWGPYAKVFYLALVLAILDMSAYWFTYSWLPDYLKEERHLSIAKSALWIMVIQTGGFLGYFSFGYVADRFGRRPAYSVYGVFWAAGLLMITLFWSAAATSIALLLACMFLVGFGTGMFGGYGPLFAELFPTSVRNTAMGAAFNLARGVQFFTPIVITSVAHTAGLGGGIALAAIFALLCGIWIWTFPETKGRVLAQE